MIAEGNVFDLDDNAVKNEGDPKTDTGEHIAVIKEEEVDSTPEWLQGLFDKVDDRDIEEVRRILNLPSYKNRVGLKVVEQGEDYQLPPVKEFGMNEYDEFALKDSLTILTNYLKKDILLDNFLERASRNEFREEFFKKFPYLTEAFKEVFEKNKLRFGNSINHVRRVVHNFTALFNAYYNPEDTELQEEVKNSAYFFDVSKLPNVQETQQALDELNGFLEKYPDQKAYEDVHNKYIKIEFARELTHLVKRLLQTFDLRQTH